MSCVSRAHWHRPFLPLHVSLRLAPRLELSMPIAVSVPSRLDGVQPAAVLDERGASLALHVGKTKAEEPEEECCSADALAACLEKARADAFGESACSNRRERHAASAAGATPNSTASVTVNITVGRRSCWRLPVPARATRAARPVWNTKCFLSARKLANPRDSSPFSKYFGRTGCPAAHCPKQPTTMLRHALRLVPRLCRTRRRAIGPQCVKTSKLPTLVVSEARGIQRMSSSSRAVDVPRGQQGQYRYVQPSARCVDQCADVPTRFPPPPTTHTHTEQSLFFARKRLAMMYQQRMGGLGWAGCLRRLWPKACSLPTTGDNSECTVTLSYPTLLSCV